MSFLTKVKFSNVNNLSDARYAAAVGIEYIGFCFDKSNPDYIAPIKAKEMIDWITGSNIVAEFGNQSIDEIKDISELLQVDAVEVNNTILPDELPQIGKAIIKKIDVNAYSQEQLANELEAYAKYCDAFHVYASTQPENYDCEQLVDLCKNYQIIWGLAISTQTVINTIHSFNPFAIHVSGGSEEKVGIKDFDDLNELLEIITLEE
jgi:phosphoribosylanthranilate isomerase